MIHQFFNPFVYSEYVSGGVEVIVRAASTPIALAALRAALGATIPREAIVRLGSFRERADADLGREHVILAMFNDLCYTLPQLRNAPASAS